MPRRPGGWSRPPRPRTVRSTSSSTTPGSPRSAWRSRTRTSAELPEDAFRHDLELNLLTAFHVTQAVLPGMLKRGYGRIVIVSSVTGPLVTTPGSAGYSAAKAAVDGMMRALAHDCGRGGVTANSVQPGWIATARRPSASSRQGDARRARRAGARGCRRGRVPRVRGGELHHRPDARRRRRQHHPGSTRGRRLRLRPERPGEPGADHDRDALDVLRILEAPGRCRRAPRCPRRAGDRGGSGPAAPARRPRLRTAGAAAGRPRARAGRESRGRSARARGRRGGAAHASRAPPPRRGRGGPA